MMTHDIERSNSFSLVMHWWFLFEPLSMHCSLLTISKYIHSLLLCQERIQWIFQRWNLKESPTMIPPYILLELGFWDNPKKNNTNVIEHHVTMLSLAMLTDQNKRLWLFTSCLQLDASQFWLVSLNSSHLEWARFMKLGPTDTTVSLSSPEI